MDSERFASPIKGIFCGGLNAYCMHIRPLFLRTSGSSGVLKALFFFFFGGRDIHYKDAMKETTSVCEGHPQQKLQATRTT